MDQLLLGQVEREWLKLRRQYCTYSSGVAHLLGICGIFKLQHICMKLLRRAATAVEYTYICTRDIFVQNVRSMLTDGWQVDGNIQQRIHAAARTISLEFGPRSGGWHHPHVNSDAWSLQSYLLWANISISFVFVPHAGGSFIGNDIWAIVSTRVAGRSTGDTNSCIALRVWWGPTYELCFELWNYTNNIGRRRGKQFGCIWFDSISSSFRESFWIGELIQFQ